MTRKTRPSPPSALVRLSRSAQSVARSWRRWSAGAAAIALGAGVLWIAREVELQVESDPRFSLEGWTLELEEMPPWVTPEIAAEIEQSYQLEGSTLVLFRRHSIPELSRALESSPWVRSVVDLELVYPTPRRRGSIRATLALRTPVALVVSGSDCYLTDREGRRLGKTYRPEDRTWFGVPLITGARVAEVPEPGAYWPHRDVLHGVSVARILYEHGIHVEFPGTPIDAIDVANADGRLDRGASEVVLVSGGRRFEWGRSPFAAGSQVLPIEQKLENLRRVLGDPRYSQVRTVSLYTSRLVGSTES